MKDTTLPKVGGGKTYTKKSHVRAFSAAHTCFFVCVCHLYLFVEEVSFIWHYWITIVMFRDYIRFINYGAKMREEDR